ncbi:MAG TPA: enoyl-CoA hydratase-related protein [Pseudonocardia sp.]|jgi:2-(1,2-epoxy-1,2-dihydrophenyl)acetyl-CoA isomerase
MGSEEPVLTELVGGVLTITLNRPHRKNAIDGPTWTLLREAIDQADGSPEVRALVITGAGGDFCAGADLGNPGADPHPLRGLQRINQAALRLHQLRIPSIAKVPGVAVGAGWNLALGCDLVVASRAARFSQIFAKRALSIDFGGSWLLPRIVGMQQAKRLVLLADMINAEEAQRLGAVTYVVEPDELDGFVTELAARLAAGPPIALAQSKALLNESFSRTMSEALDSEARVQAVNVGTADAGVAYRAFRDQTEPTFTGEWGMPG